MKQVIILFTLLLSLISTKSWGSTEKPLFFLTYKIEGDSLGKKEVEGLPGLFFTKFGDALKKEFPCVQINSLDVIQSMIGFVREQQILGTPGADKNLENIPGAMGSEYLVVLKINCFHQSNTIFFSSSCTEISTGQKMSFADGNSPINGNWVKVLSDITQKLVYGLKDYEICPYKGTVNVQVLSDTTEEKTNEHPVYCSKMDRHYKKTVTHEKKSDADWQLQKTGKYTGDGTIRYAMAEKHSIEEWNECYTCEPLITGNRHYSDVTVNYIEIEGLSERTKNNGDYVKYATFRIKFRQDSTYTITLDAASQPGELKTIREEKADGDCQTTTKPQELHSNKMSIPLHKILGPYKGNGLNKTLKEEETFDQIDPVTKERTTYKISFNLKRE